MSCPACFAGHEASAEDSPPPTGTVETVHGRSTYVARPPPGPKTDDTGSTAAAAAPPRGAVVLIPDAYGWEFANNRLLADNLARKGRFIVYLPDLMKGPAAPTSVLPAMRALRKEGGGIMGFFRRTWAILSAIPRIVPFILRNLPGKTHPGVRDFVSALGAASPSVPLFAAGYCWGGKHAFLLAAAPPHAALKAVFTGHPSMLTLPADAAAVRLPLSVAVGSRDDAVGPKEVATIKAALDTVAAEREGAAGEVVVYDGASHGFCVRLDRSDETERRHAGEAEDQAVRWFERFLE